MAKYEISHPELPQLKGILELEDGVQPSEKHFWEATKTMVRPYGASQLSDNAKIAAYKNGFFDTPSAPILDVEDNPDTLQNEEQPGLLSSLGDMVSELGTRIDPLTSPYSKVVQLEDKPVAYKNTENLEQFREAGKRLFGLLDNQQSLSELGFDPISEALKQTGMPFYAKNADARGRVKAAAMDYATDNIKASAGMGAVRAWKTPEFLLRGGSYLANKINLDEEDDQEILEYVNSAIGFDKVNYEYETAADLAAWVMDNPIDAIKATVGVEPESMSFDSQLEQDIRSGYQEPSEGVGLAFEIALDPFNAAGAPLAKGVTAPMRIGLKGRMLKTIKDVQQKTTELAKYQNILRKLPEDALVKGRVVQQIERVAGELTEQQKILQKYGSNSLHLRLMGKASPETLGKVAMETFDQSTDAGKMGMSLVQEATKASDKMSKLRRVANTAAKFNPEIAGATVGGLMFGPVGATVGASIPTVLKLARFISTMPENVATRYIITAAQNAGEEITEQAARQRYRNYKNLVGAGLGLGSLAAGLVFDQDALGGTGGIASLSVLLGPQALSLFDNIARDARVVGSELTLARTGDHTPFFRRLAMLPTPDQGLAGATMDKFNILMRPGPEGLLNRGFDAIVQGGKASGKEVFPSKQAFRVGSQGEKIGQAPTISKGTQKFANFMDNAGVLGRLGTPAESLGRFAKGMAIGSTIPASIGYVASGGQASGAVAGTIMSAPFTALGTGAGMYQNYKTKGDLYAKQIGDIQYYREHLNKQERADFDALPAHIRAQVAGYSLSHPDVVFKQTTEGEGGFNPVTMEVSYNPNGTGYLKGTMAHEITHFIEVHGLTPMVNRILFGNKETRTAGEFASYDSDGNIVYTDEFLELRDIYMDRLRKDASLDPDAVAEYEANPQKIGREIFADQGTDYLLSGKREKSLNQGPVGKLLQETLNGITGVSFLRDFLLKLNLPLNSEGKFITSTDLFKGKLRKIPELQNLIDKYYKDVRGLKKAQIEGSEFTDPFTGTTRKQEGSKPIDDEFETLYTVEDQKNPNVVDKLNTGGIYKTNPQTGEVEKDALGNPIRMTKGEADKVSKAAGDHASEVFKKNGIEVETNDKGQPFVKDLPALTEEIIDQLAKGPIHPRQIATLREISRALRQGDGERAGMLIGYYAATQGRKAKAVPFKVRTTMPYGFELTAQGNILVRIHDVDQIQKNLQFLKGERQPKKLPKELVGMYDELFGNDNAVWDAFALYRQNTANGIDGRTGLDSDPVIANKKLNFLNALHGGITKSQVAMNPVLNAIGYQMAGINKRSNPFGPATKTFRLDRVFNAQRSGKASPVNEQRVINLMSPQGQKLYTPKPEITDKLFMPASEAGAGKGKLAEAADLDFKISTRNPTAKNATENPITEDLIINTASIADDVTMLESHALALQEYPGIKRNSKVPKRIIDSFVDHVVDNLLYLHDQVRPEVRSRSKLWYDGARNITEKWNKKYGNDKQAIAAALASLSPQKDWFMNVDLARRMLDIYKDQSGFAFDKAMAKKYIQLFEKGIGKKKATEIAEAMVGKTLNDLKSDYEQAAFIRSYDEVYNPREYQVVSPEGDFIGLAKSLDGANKKVAWGSMTEISEAVKVLRNPSKESISTALGNAHKIRNFYNNILLPNADKFSVTIDTHAIAAALLRPLAGADLEVANNFGSKPKGAKRSIKNSSVKGISGTYGIYADAYRKAAEARGILPREMQSITWEAIRGLYEAKWKTKSNKGKIDNLWEKYENGELTLNETREQILEVAGGITEPEWVTERSNSRADGTNESANNSQELYRSELGGSQLRTNPRGGRTNSRGSQEVNFLPAGNFSRQPANRITRQAPSMPGNRFMLPAVSAGAKSAERFR